jgi:hydrogenase maturation protein HypF
MLATRVRSPLAHGCGRYFDAIGSLVLRRPESRYEGQIALEWNAVADPAEGGRYDYDIDRQASPWTIDLRAMVRAVVHDLMDGVRAPQIAARFHNTIVAATVDVVRATAAVYGQLPVVLTGGCSRIRGWPRVSRVRLRRNLPSTCTGKCRQGTGVLLSDRPWWRRRSRAAPVCEQIGRSHGSGPAEEQRYVSGCTRQSR